MSDRESSRPDRGSVRPAAGLKTDAPTEVILARPDAETAEGPRPQIGASPTAALATGDPGPISAVPPLDGAGGCHRYQLLEFLGAGGMGAVYKARHRLMDRVVALKVLGRHLVTDPGMVERFRREVRAAAFLSHPNIVTAFDADHANGIHFLVMEYVEGRSLDRVLAARGPLPVAEACDYARQAALGLQHAHEKGMVHRDVKPHNLMLTPAGRVKVLDFGLARFASEAGLPAAPTHSGLGHEPMPGDGLHEAATRIVRPAGPAAGSVLMGTADYMAPEEAADARRADIRADIYGLGATLYHLLAGHPPFPGGDPVAKLDRHLWETPEPLHRVRTDVPPDLAAAVGRMLAKDPADRFPTPAEAAAALARFAGPAGRRVLVVEADPARRTALTRGLRGRGFTAEAATGGADALERLRAGPRPELVLLDLAGPRSDGWAFLRSLQDDRGLAGIPVVLVSADDPERALAAALGAAGST